MSVRDCGEIPLRERFAGAQLVWRWLGYPLSRTVRHLPTRPANWVWEEIVGPLMSLCYELDD